MTTQSRNSIYRFGRHAANTDFFTIASSLQKIVPFSFPEGMQPRSRKPHERQNFGENIPLAGNVGVMDTSPFGLQMRLRGCNGNTSGGAVAMNTSNDLGLMLSCIFGANATDVSGSATTITGGTPGSGILTVASGADIANESFVAFSTTAGFVFRQVESGGGTATLTLDRPYTGTPTNGAAVIRAPYFKTLSSVTDHVHAYFDAFTHYDGSTWQQSQFFGCMSNAKFNAPAGQPVVIDMEWAPSSVVVNDAVATPGTAVATEGNLIINAGGCLYIGDDEYMVKGVSWDLGQQVVTREATFGNDGIWGHHVGDKTPTLTATFYHGTSRTRGELLSADATSTDLREMLHLDKYVGETERTHDIGIQIGSNFRAGAYLRMPAAVIKDIKHTLVNGAHAVTATFSAVDRSAYAPFYMGIF